jgi:hypothetical protein
MTTLNDFMHGLSLPLDTVFFIGSQSSYFFCGTLAEYERDIDTIERLTYKALVELLRRMERQLASNQDDIAKFNRHIQRNFPKSVTDYPSIYEVSEHDFSKYKQKVKEYQNTLKKAFDEMQRSLEHKLDIINTAELSVRRTAERIDDFKPMRERIVTDCYKKDMPNAYNEVAILVQGDEVGSFWLKREYDAWRLAHIADFGGTCDGK